MAHWKAVAQPKHVDRKALQESSRAHGEDGAYKRSEKLARKIALNGPEYYFGKPEQHARAMRRAMGGPAVGMSGVPKDRWELAFGKG